MKTYTFKVVAEPDEDAMGNPEWHAYSPALESRGAATSGRSQEETLKNINEVVRMIVQEFIDEGKSLPEGAQHHLEVSEISIDSFEAANTLLPGGLQRGAPKLRIVAID